MKNLCLLTTLTRSLDNYHNIRRSNQIHLISSVCNFERSLLVFENLALNSKNKYEYILHVTPLTVESLQNLTEISVVEPSCKIYLNKLVVFEMSMLWLFVNYMKYNSYSETKFEDFLLNVISNLSSEVPGFTKNNILTKILFIFDSVNWSTLQLLFKILNINLSGGSISKRHFISTSEYNLSRYLILLGINDVDIYKSYVLNKEAINLSIDISKLVLPTELFILIIKIKTEEVIIHMTENIKQLENKIKNYNNDIKSLEVSSLIKQTKKNKTKSSIVIPDISDKTKKSIEKIKNLSLESEKEILKLKSVISDIKVSIDNLSNKSYDEVKNIYMKYFHNLNLFQNPKKILKVFNRSIFIPTSNISSKENLSIRREYSTLINLRGMNSNFKNITDYPNSLIWNKFSIKNMSLYANNSIISNNLMEILYSDDSKENIQKNIEHFLIHQQNKLLLKDIQNIKYKWVNPKIINVFIESKLLIEKLHSNIPLINQEKVALKLIGTLNLDNIINILFGKVLLIINNNNLNNKFTFLTDVSYDLGQQVINTYNYNLYLANNNKEIKFNEFILNNPTKIIKSDDSTNLVLIGSTLISWLLEIKLLSTKLVFLGKNEKRNILIAGDKINKFLNKQDNKILINLPVKLPMICKPKSYLNDNDNDNDNDSKKLGGFLLNDEVYIEPLIIEKIHLAFKSSISKNNIIYKLVDDINSVPFSINQDVLDFITKYYKTFNLIIDPDYTHPLELKTKLTLSEKKELESFRSKVNLEFEILNLAHIFRNSPELFIPVRLDYRGRLYCNVEYLHYQSVELAKSLLQFSKGDIVYINDEVSIKYLKIFGANCYGNRLDKMSFNDRIDWIDKNQKNILNFSNGKLISKADNKLLFIAFCFEYNKYLDAINNNQDKFITHLPIQLDASCNGFQHLSLLLEDTTLAKQVNLSESTWNNIPDDFYTFLSLKIKDHLKLELINNKCLESEKRDSYNRLIELDFKNHRNLVKKTIMTIPYNSTKYANILDMKEEFNLVKKNGESLFIYKNNNKIILKNIDFQVICNTLYLCLYRDFPKLEILLNYFKNIATISNKLGINIPWNLPTGLNVKQKFYGTKKIKFKPFIYSKDLLNLNIIDKNTINPRKQIRSLMPNLVHSLDAASLSLLIHNFFKEDQHNNFYSIHDCFAVTCNKVNIIYELLKLSYYHIYINKPFLLTFDKNFKESILIQFGENSYSEETNQITIINEEGDKLILPYPNINEVFTSENLNFMKSSYCIG